MKPKDKAYWLADKIPAYGDYAKEAAWVLRKQADEIDRLREVVEAAAAIDEVGADSGCRLRLAIMARRALSPNVKVSRNQQRPQNDK